MKGFITIALTAVLGLCLLSMTGCAGGGYSSVGVSSGDYWGPYSTYRPRYDYDYRHNHSYDSSRHKRRAVGRPNGEHINSGQRQRAAVRAGGQRR
jgi:hypothetical protein